MICRDTSQERFVPEPPGALKQQEIVLRVQGSFQILKDVKHWLYIRH